MVIDELIVRKGTTRYPIDSYDNKMIDEIVVEGQKFHFAKQKDLTGTSEIVADNGVEEPIISLGVSGATSQVLLPTEYQQVAYIESTGTQYIDTGIKATEKVKIISKVQITYAKSTPAKGRSGMVMAGSAGHIVFGDYGLGNLVAYFSNTGMNGATIPFDNNWHTYHIENGLQKIDEVSATNTINGTLDGLTLYLLNAHIGWTGETMVASQRMAYTKIWDNGVLVRDYIPCYRKADNVVGMYDLVNGVFYTNSGTGTFVKGADYNQTLTPTPEAPIPIENANDNGMSVALHGKNLATAEQVCEKFYKYKKQEFDGRECVSFTQEQTKYFALEGGFKPNTQYTLSFDVNTTGSGTGHIMFVLYEDIALNYARDSVGTTGDGGWKHIVKTTLAGHTVKGIGQKHLNSLRTIYIDVNSLMLQEGAITDPVYEPYFRETVEIPTEITSTVDKPILNNGVALADGKSVPLLFTEYDKLTVDRLNNKVIYTQGNYKRTYTGNESLYASTFSENNGYGRWYCDSANLPITSTALCTHFKRTSWIPDLSVKNVFVPAEVTSTTKRIFFKTDGSMNDTFANDMTKFKEWLKTQHDAGTPVTVIAKRITPIEHDITNTDLGQSLLALATGKGTNYLEITSNLAPSQTDLSYWRQIIPNE